MIGTRIANFQITQELGTGGMGTVYKAKDLNLNRYVALKMLHSHIMSNSNSYKRFKNEAQISAQISHANVAMLYDFIEFNGKSYIIMEYVDGHTLEKELGDKKTLSESECINITIQILKGLTEAHELDILHRDLKPSNLMIKKNGYVKLMDFGIARMENATRLTAQNKVVGTIEYMAPEILKGQDPNRTSDLYAVGVMMHEMLSGTTLYKSQSEASLMYQIVNEKPQYKLSSVNSGLAKIIKKLVKKNPQHRYRSTLDVITDLENVSRSMAAVTSSPKLSLPNINLSRIKDLIPLFSLPSVNLSMGKGMKFILFSVLASLFIITLGSLFSDKEKMEIEDTVDENTVIIDESKGESDSDKNTYKGGNIEKSSEPRFKQQGIEVVLPKENSKPQSKANIENPETKKVTKKNPTQAKKETSKNSDKTNHKKESETSKDQTNKDNYAAQKTKSKSIEIEKNETSTEKIKKEDQAEEISKEIVEKPVSIETNTAEKKKIAVQLFLQEQYLPITFGAVVNSKNYNEGDLLKFRTARSLRIGSDVVIENNALVRARVSRKKIKNNGKVIFAIQIEAVQAVNGEWIGLEYPEYSDIQKGAVIIPASTTINKVKIKSQQITIYK